ncbi:MAG: hypothetical protein L3K17_10480, partial [Thermoplasmata archaeon]|nr:hypothetical protein [Thermoplasmata archaeon]
NPDRLTVDPASGLAFVDDANSGNLTVVDDSSMMVVANLATGGGASGLAFDPADGEVYEAQSGVAALQVFNGGSGAALPNVTVSNDPVGLAYDPTFGGIWVLDGGSSIASLVVGGAWESGLNVTLPELPRAAAFDPATGTTAILSGLGGAVYTLVPTWGYPATFSAIGLPPSDAWSVDIAGQSTVVNGTSVTFDLGDGRYAYAVNAPAGFTATPSGGPLVVNGSALVVDIVFTRVPVAMYTINFAETGLPGSTPWSVTINGSMFTATGPTLNPALPNGSFGYFVGDPAGYRSAPSDGIVVVKGGGAAVAITFAAISPNPANNSTSKTPVSTTTSTPSWGNTLLVVAVVVEAIAVIVLAIVLLRRGGPGTAATYPAPLTPILYGPPVGAVGPTPGGGAPPPVK